MSYHHDVDFETTVLGGLPVRVTANIARAEPDVGYMYDWIDEYAIYWIGKKERLVPQSILERIEASRYEVDRLDEAIIEEFRLGKMKNDY